MGCMRKFSVYLVLAALAAGLAFNLVVVSSCEYMRAKDHDVQLGVFQFAVNDTSSEHNTVGECKAYTNSDDIEWQVEMARTCAIIAPVCGAVLILLVAITQCCSPIPCSGPIITMGYVGCHFGTAFVWLIQSNDLCKNYLGGCNWGDAAWCNLFAQVAYLAAAFLHRFLPDPKLAAETRRADKAEAALAEQQGNQQPPETHTSNNVATNAEVQRLQQQLEAQKQATSAAESRAMSAETRANTLQTQFNTQATDLQEQRNLLAAATAAATTTAAAEAAKISTLNEQIKQKEKEMEVTQNELTEAKEDAEQQRNALAAATAATTTAAAAEALEIKKLKKKLKAKEEELEKAKDSLAVAAGVTSATATAEAMTIKELQEKIKEQNEELEALKQVMSDSPIFTDAGNAQSAPPPPEEDPETVVPVAQDVDAEINEIKAEYEKQIQDLEEENNVLKGLAAAGVAGTTAEAAEIQKLKEQLEDYEQKLKELQGDDLPVYNPNNFDAADPDGTSGAEQQKLLALQAQMDQQKEEYEAKIKELEGQNASAEVVDMKQLKEELDRQKEELKLIKAGSATPAEPLEEAEKKDPPMLDPPTSNPSAIDPEMSEATGASTSSPREGEDVADSQGDEMHKLKEELEQQKQEIDQMKAATEQAAGGKDGPEAADPPTDDPPETNAEASQPGGVRASKVGAAITSDKEAQILLLSEELARLKAELAEAKGTPMDADTGETIDPPVSNSIAAQPGGVRGSVLEQSAEDEPPSPEEKQEASNDLQLGDPPENPNAAQPGGMRGSVVENSKGEEPPREEQQQQD